MHCEHISLACQCVGRIERTELIYTRLLKLSVFKIVKMVGLGGLEPPTSPLSGVRSNQAELQTQSCLHKIDSTQIFGERIIRVVSFFVNEKVGINYYALFNFYLAKDLYKLKYT